MTTTRRGFLVGTLATLTAGLAGDQPKGKTMAYAQDDLTPLLARPTEQSGGLDFGQAVITSYNAETGLNPGTHTCTAKYRSSTSGETALFAERDLTVTAF